MTHPELDALPENVRRRIFICEETGCWLWTGSDSGKGRGGGYARVSFKGITVAVHLLVYRILRGRIPKGRQLDHTCVRRLCVNPAHMDVVTQRVNCIRRDRRARLAERASSCPPTS